MERHTKSYAPRRRAFAITTFASTILTAVAGCASQQSPGTVPTNTTSSAEMHSDAGATTVAEADSGSTTVASTEPSQTATVAAQEDAAVTPVAPVPILPGIHALPPTVSEGLSPEVIRRVILRNINRLRHCQEEAARTTPGFTGRITVAFVIGTNGKVKTSTATANDTNNTTFGDCVAQTLAGYDFPVPNNHQEVTVSYAFTFGPATTTSPPVEGMRM